MAIEISDFRLQTLTLEVRYDSAFGLWDNAGRLALDLQKAFPTLKPKGTIQPNQQTYSLKPGLDATVQLTSAHIGQTRPPSNLTELCSSADLFFQVVLRQFMSADLLRIGLRPIFEKTFATKYDVARYICDQQKVFRRSGEFFNLVGAQVLEPTLALRWEDDKLGCMVRLISQDQRLEVDIPPEFTEKPNFETHRSAVVLDIDYYTRTNTSVSKFKASGIIENWMKLIRRDVGGFLGD